jgi:hypothetical protein
MEYTTGNTSGATGWRPTRRTWVRLAVVAAGVPLILAAAACGHVMMMMHGSDVQPPPADEFGLGPRSSANQLYTAVLDPGEPLRPRQMRTVKAVVRDAAGTPVDGAAIQVDGGMPQHNHGLPTRPRVTRNHGGGVYEIEGVRFNMGGWWEFKLVIDGPAGHDVVTFNLDL